MSTGSGGLGPTEDDLTVEVLAVLAGVDIKIPKNEVLPRGEYIRLPMDLMLLAF